MPGPKNTTLKITPKKHTKVLGVYIDKNLRWDKQVNYVKKNALNVVPKFQKIKITVNYSCPPPPLPSWKYQI